MSLKIYININKKCQIVIKINSKKTIKNINKYLNITMNTLKNGILK